MIHKIIGWILGISFFITLIFLMSEANQAKQKEVEDCISSGKTMGSSES